MATKRGITLYHSPASRAFAAYWMLEEIGVAFDVKTVDIRKGEQKDPAYLRLNPAGKVPTLTDGDVVVSENPAIAIYLADRYSYGTLAPKIEDAERGAYLKWMVYATAVVDPVAYLHEQSIDLPGFGPGFGTFDDMVSVLSTSLAGRKWLLGDRFSAADVVLGGTISQLMYRKVLPKDPVLVDYNASPCAKPTIAPPTPPGRRTCSRRWARADRAGAVRRPQALRPRPCSRVMETRS